MSKYVHKTNIWCQVEGYSALLIRHQSQEIGNFDNLTFVALKHGQFLVCFPKTTIPFGGGGGSLVPLLWKSADVYLRLHSHSGSLTSVSCRFTAGATPDNLLATSSAAKPVYPLTFSSIGRTRNHDNVCGTVLVRRVL